MYEISTKIKEGGIYYTDTENIISKTVIQSTGGIDNRPVLVLRSKLQFDHDNVLIVPGTTNLNARTTNVKYGDKVYRFKLHELKTVAASYLKNELCCLPPNILELFRCISEAYTLCRVSNAANIVRELHRFYALVPEYREDIKNAITYVMKNFAHVSGIAKANSDNKSIGQDLTKSAETGSNAVDIKSKANDEAIKVENDSETSLPTDNNIDTTTSNVSNIVADIAETNTSLVNENDEVVNDNKLLGFTIEEWSAFGRHFKCQDVLNIIFNTNTKICYKINYCSDILDTFNSDYRAFITRCRKSVAYGHNMGKFAPYQLVLAKLLVDTGKVFLRKKLKMSEVSTPICKILHNVSDEDLVLNAAIFIVSPDTANSIKISLLKLLYPDSVYVSNIEQTDNDQQSNNNTDMDTKRYEESTKAFGDTNATLDMLLMLHQNDWRHFIHTAKLSTGSIKMLYPGTSPVSTYIEMDANDFNKIISYVPIQFIDRLYETFIGSQVSREFIRKMSPVAYIMYHKSNWYVKTELDLDRLSSYDSSMVKYMLNGDKLLETIAITLSPKDVTDKIGIKANSRRRFCEWLGYKITLKPDNKLSSKTPQSNGGSRQEVMPCLRENSSKSHEGDVSIDKKSDNGLESPVKQDIIDKENTCSFRILNYERTDIINYLAHNNFESSHKAMGISKASKFERMRELDNPNVTDRMLENIPDRFKKMYDKSYIVTAMKAPIAFMPLVYMAYTSKRWLTRMEPETYLPIALNIIAERIDLTDDIFLELSALYCANRKMLKTIGITVHERLRILKRYGIYGNR